VKSPRRENSPTVNISKGSRIGANEIAKNIASHSLVPNMSKIQSKFSFNLLF
jgi:hypothetical protein